MSSLRALEVVCEALRPEKRNGLSGIGEETWQAALALANDHFVAPALYAALEQSQRLTELPADVRDYLALLHHGNSVRNRRLRQQALELLDSLAAAGVHGLLLKGGVTLFLDSAEPSGRMIRDLDVLVPREAADDALVVLHRLGYRVIERYPAGHNAFGELARVGDPGAVDLHFELIDTPHVLPAADVWRRAVEIAAGSTRFFIPSPTDRVLHNVLHAQIHHLANYYLGTIELRQLHDLATLTRRYGPDIDWPFIDDCLTRHRLRPPLYAHAFAAHRLLESPWMLPGPPTLAARLHLRRCLLQLQAPLLARLSVPFANLQAAFASHRMDALYARRGPLLMRRLHHATRFLHKGSAGDWIARLLRSPAHPRGWRR